MIDAAHAPNKSLMPELMVTGGLRVAPAGDQPGRRPKRPHALLGLDDQYSKEDMR